jgi:DNA-binding transcriptional MocR family regulator
MIDRRFFALDDYNRIQAQYFADLKRQGRVRADPSGWLDTYSSAEALLPAHSLPPHSITRYFVDEGSALGPPKERIRRLLSAWESREISIDGFTLCPSCGNASLVTLSTLKDCGVKKILFETPAYFATIEQAALLRIPFQLLPTYRDQNYRLPDLGQYMSRNLPTAIWLTHPRASLGFDQPHKLIRALLEQAGPRGYLVIDEATDQSYPAHLGGKSRFPRDRLIRLRSFTKGMGLNGFRAAVILHPDKLRENLTHSIEALGGSLDAHSLFAVAEFAAAPARFHRMLAAASQQVNDLRHVAERLVRGSPVTINRLTNGYIGSMVLDLSLIGRSQAVRRRRLLEWCKAVETPVILGASMYIAKAPPTETIRLNFFNLPDHIVRGVTNILRLWSDL